MAKPIKNKKKWYQPFLFPAVVACVLIGIILVAVKPEVDRFTLIMPVFAGYILYMILTTSD